MNHNIEAACALVTGGAVLAGLPYKIDSTFFTLKDERIHTPVRIGVIADLHCREFGKGQKWIKKKIDKAHPDLIIIPGDLFDKNRDYQKSLELIDVLHDYPIYFSSGNHDRRIYKDIAELREVMIRKGVHVLEDKSEVFVKEDTLLEIAGMSDRGRKPLYSPERFSSVYKTGYYRILISHRPDYIDFYRNVQCDLILCGHNHGGQWRIPFTHQGIVSPGNGLFPGYTEGVHDLNGRKMVISRGLASGSPLIPRLYNNPEIVFVDLKGETV